MEFEFKTNPTNDEVYASPFASHAAYHRARKRQAKLDQWQQRNDENSTASERSSRLPAHLDNPYPGSMSQRALHPQSEQASKPSLIPELSPSDEKFARDAWSMYHDKFCDSFNDKRFLQRFAVALHLAIPDEVLDDTKKALAVRLIESQDAYKKFQQ
jgi:hypothetical protein